MDNMNEQEMEIPNGLISYLILWLRDHGHTEKEVLDCILYICSDGKINEYDDLKNIN